jgi:hypothetical protein
MHLREGLSGRAEQDEPLCVHEAEHENAPVLLHLGDSWAGLFDGGRWGRSYLLHFFLYHMLDNII